MTDGFYRIAFTGAHGSGFGLLVLFEGAVAGADVGGVLYDGTYRTDEAKNHMNLQITMRAPAGSTPVQTGIPLVAPIDVPMAISLPRSEERRVGKECW